MFFPLPPENVVQRTMIVNPKMSWYFGDARVSYNRLIAIVGNWGHDVNFYDLAYSGRAESLDESNVDRDIAGHSWATPKLNYPFIYKKQGSTLQGLSDTEYYGTQPGGEMRGEYPMLTNVSTVYDYKYQPGNNREHLKALVPIFPEYQIFSQGFDTALLDSDDVRIINIPKIFYGTRVKTGSVDLKFYGGAIDAKTLIGRAQDIKGDGILIQTESLTGAHDGEQVGVVLYGHGIILLTAYWDLAPAAAPYQGRYRFELGDLAFYPPRWAYFGSMGNPGGLVLTMGACEMFIEGHHEIENVTYMLPCENLNFSNNPTFLTAPREQELTSRSFIEKPGRAEVYNTSATPYETDDSYQAQVFISKVGLFDKNHNLLGVVSLATPAKMYRGRKLLMKASFDI